MGSFAAPEMHRRLSARSQVRVFDLPCKAGSVPLQEVPMDPNPPFSPSPEGRVRYARPELDRRDLLERSADLDGPRNLDATLPGQPPGSDLG